MPRGTANGRLLKALLFDLAGRAGLLRCFRCGQSITSLEEFSIDHKEVWENTGREVELFFDLRNVAFSHRACNFRAARRRQLYFTEKERNYAEYHQLKADPARYARKMARREERRKAAREAGVQPPYS